jgi:hypothetical protein
MNARIRGSRPARLLTAGAVAALFTAVARGDAPNEPGAYCPLPEAGEVPKCLEPAKAEYSGFFAAVDEGGVDDAAAARVEADMAGGAGADQPYLALNSLSYGYYRLAQRVASDPEADPALVARLERWNELFATAFETSRDDPGYREAVRSAARDLRARTSVRVGCVDAMGNPVECDSTEDVLRGLDATSHDVGVRGALERLIERITGDGES